VTADTPDPRPVCAEPGCGLPADLHGAPPGDPPNPTRSTHRLRRVLDDRADEPVWRARDAIETAVAADAARAAPRAEQWPEARYRVHDDEGNHIADHPVVAPQADEGLEGYWEKAYWEIVPKLQSALAAAPQADEGLVEFIDSVISVTPRRTGSSYADGVSEGIHTALIVVREKASQLAAAAPVPAGLDVERLARAVHEDAESIESDPTDWDECFDKAEHREYATFLADQYAALSQLPEDAP